MRSKARFSYRSLFLVAILVCAMTGQDGHAQESTFPRIANPVEETGSVRVHCLELSRIASQTSTRITWSVLFMIEYLGDEPIDSLATSSVEFLDAAGEVISFEVGGDNSSPQSGGSLIALEQFMSVWPVDFPKPSASGRTYISRNWFCHPIPAGTAALRIRIGKNGAADAISFRFEQ